MLDLPEFQALQSLAFDGEPDEVAQNFLNHAMESLSKVLLDESKYQEKDVQEALHCFDQGLDAKATDNEINFGLYQGRAKLNLLRA